MVRQLPQERRHPEAEFFGYSIEISELLAGIALIARPLIWLFAWERVSDRVRYAVLFFTAAAGGTFLAINLHLANGASHPWLIPGDAFDEGIDLDSVLPAIQLVIATVSIILLRRLRQESADAMEIVMHRSRTTGPAAHQVDPRDRVQPPDA